MPRHGAHHVTLIPGDGIGPEVIGAAAEVVAATGVDIVWDRQEAGMAAVKKCGTPVPEGLIRSVRKNRVALKGPLMTGVGQGYRSVNVALRKTFDLYANLRPIRNLPGLRTEMVRAITKALPSQVRDNTYRRISASASRSSARQ